MADDDLLDRIAGDFIGILIRIPPIIHRKLLSRRGIAGLPLAEYKVLGVLATHGCLSISEIGVRLYISKPYMTRLVDHLIAGSLVERSPNPRDRRVTNIVITKAGIRHLRTFGHLFRDDIKAVLSDMDDAELREVIKSLENLNRLLERLGSHDVPGSETV